MKEIIKKGSVFFLLASMLTLTSCGSDNTSAKMDFEETEYDFGNIKQGDKVVHDFKFTNTGGADLVITNAKGSCGCTVPEYPKTPIKPGESGKIMVSFNSAGKHDQVKKTVAITCNTKEGNEILKIKANIQVPQQAN